MGSRWEMERKKDPYYRRAKSEDYRSRASYKLKQLNKRFKIIKEGNTVVDLGAAPGGWSQVALEKIGEDGVVVGVDLNRIKPFPEGNFYGIRGDFTKDIVQEKVMELTNGKVDVLMSDASPSLSGVKSIDHLRSIDLITFQGPEYKTVLDDIKKRFRKVKSTKPPSSRNRSSEMYIVALGFKRPKNQAKRENKDLE